MDTTAPTKCLILCTANRCRSKTLEALLNATPGFIAKSAGTHPIGDGRAITQEDLLWASTIIVFERRHVKHLRNHFWTLFPTLPITLFDIPDEYEPYDPELIRLLREQCQTTFGIIITPEMSANAAARHALAEEKLRGPIVSMEPLEGGHQGGKLVLMFRDGTKALFKPMTGERGVRSTTPEDHVDDALTAIKQSLTHREQQWLTNLISAWGEQKVLRMWESLRVQLEWARHL